MATPPIDPLLVHRMTVKRRNPGLDPFGQPLQGTGDYTTHLSGVPCRLTTGRGGVVVGQDLQDVVDINYRLVTLPNVDIEEVDRVDVVDADGQTLLEDAQVSHVRAVTGGDGKEHHRSCVLDVARSGAVVQP